MAWLILIIAGFFESGWAIALTKCDGLKKIRPIVAFIIFMTGSLAGLAAAMRSLPIGTCYTVWTAVGTALTVIYAIATGTEKITLIRVLLLLILLGCAAGLKAVS
ncbi:SMR family transporter [Arcanobacterium hippocoleae]